MYYLLQYRLTWGYIEQKPENDSRSIVCVNIFLAFSFHWFLSPLIGDCLISYACLPSLVLVSFRTPSLLFKPGLAVLLKQHTYKGNLVLYNILMRFLFTAAYIASYVNGSANVNKPTGSDAEDPAPSEADWISEFLASGKALLRNDGTPSVSSIERGPNLNPIIDPIFIPPYSTVEDSASDFQGSRSIPTDMQGGFQQTLTREFYQASTIVDKKWSIEEALDFLAQAEPQDLTRIRVRGHLEPLVEQLALKHWTRQPIRITSGGYVKLTSGESGVTTTATSDDSDLEKQFVSRGPSGDQIAIKGWFTQVANQIIASGLLNLNEGNPDLETLRNMYLGIGRFLGMSLIRQIPTGLANHPDFAATMLGMGASASSSETGWSVISEGFRSVMLPSVTDSLEITPEVFCNLVNGEPVSADAVIHRLIFKSQPYSIFASEMVSKKTEIVNWLKFKLGSASQNVLESFLYTLTGSPRLSANWQRLMVYVSASPVPLEINGKIVDYSVPGPKFGREELALSMSISAPLTSLDQAFDTLFGN